MKSLIPILALSLLILVSYGSNADSRDVFEKTELVTGENDELVSKTVIRVAEADQTNDELESIVNKIQNKYEKVQDFHAQFTQEAAVRALDKIQKAEGEVWFKKPGKMRWNYESPSEDVIVSDGKKLWLYNEQENQVIESTLSEVTNTQTTTTLLSGFGNIKKLFKASFSDNQQFKENGAYVLDLRPKEDEDEYNKVTIAVDKKSMLVNKVYLYDPFGNVTKVKLNNIETNGGVSDSLFKFDVPKGVEVIKAPSVKQ